MRCSALAVAAAIAVAAAAAPVPASAAPPATTKVLTFVIENHSLEQMRAQMPYLNGLAERYGYATAYSAVTHPSLGNYLAIAYGDDFGVVDDLGPAAHPVNAQDVFTGAVKAGTGGAVYAEDMPGNCYRRNATPYVVRHNPWAYSTRKAGCNAGDVPSGGPESGALLDATNAGALPCAGMVVPNLIHDAHDAPLSAADDYLQSWLPTLMAGPDFAAGRLAIVVTADEASAGAPDNDVLTVVISPRVTGAVVTTPLTHYSLSKLYSTTCGSRPQRKAATAPSMKAAFGL